MDPYGRITAARGVRNRASSGLRRLFAVAAVCLAGFAAHAAELVVNGSFEINGGAGSQSFSNWIIAKQPGSPGGFYAQTGVVAPITPFAVPPPPVGTFTAMSDQTGPGSTVLYQDVTVPSGTAPTFSVRLFVQNQADDYFAPTTLDYTTIPNQQVRVDVMSVGAPLFDVGAGVLRNLFITLPGSPQIQGYLVVASDLSAYAGQTVRIRVAEVDNQQGLNVGVDAVSVVVGASSTVLSMTAIAGTPQNATVGSPYAVPLAVRVVDGNNAPAANVAVTFTVPAAGASGTFAGKATVLTDAGGISPAPSLTANLVAGPFVATAAAGTLSATFSLTNVAAGVPSITAVAGTPQTTIIGTLFPAALQALVRDGGGNPVSGATVTFLLPASGASGTFPGNVTTVNVSTGLNGIASAPAVTANSVAGSFIATATSSGVTVPASFSLTNTYQAPTIGKLFSPGTIALGGTGALVFTLGNPAANTGALTGVSFTDILPGGMVVATPNGLTGSCGGGTITAIAGSNSVSLSGATLAQSSICTFSVNVTVSTVGNHFNTTGPVSSTNGVSGGTASASLVVPPDPVPALSDWGLALMSGLTIVVGLFALRRPERRSV
jgi:hypothetical protein